MTKRTHWYAPSLGVEDEPLLLSLVKYRQSKNRRQVSEENANLVASITTDGRQMPILDLDFPHHIEPSSTPGHNHLYFDVPMSKWRWFWLMAALRYAGVIESGFFAWSVRRGGNFVRLPGAPAKLPGVESTKSDYGWLFKRRVKS